MEQHFLMKLYDRRLLNGYVERLGVQHLVDVQLSNTLPPRVIVILERIND